MFFGHGWFEWASLFVPVFGSFLAAGYGAKYGASEAAKGERANRLLERKDSEARQRRLLFLRLKGDVVRLDGIDRAMETAEAISPLIPAAPDSLEAMWEGFTAQREAVLLFGNDDIAERLEFFYDKIRSLRGWFDNWHSEEQARLSIGNPNVAEITRRAAFARQWVTGHLGTGRRLLDDVADLIGEQRPNTTPSKDFPSSAPKEGPPSTGVKSNG